MADHVITLSSRLQSPEEDDRRELHNSAIVMINGERYFVYVTEVRDGETKVRQATLEQFTHLGEEISQQIAQSPNETKYEIKADKTIHEKFVQHSRAVPSDRWDWLKSKHQNEMKNRYEQWIGKNFQYNKKGEENILLNAPKNWQQNPFAHSANVANREISENCSHMTNDPDTLEQAQAGFFKDGVWDLAALRQQIERDIYGRICYKINGHSLLTPEEIEELASRKGDQKRISRNAFNRLLSLLALSLNFDHEINEKLLTERQKSVLQFMTLLHQGTFVPFISSLMSYAMPLDVGMATKAFEGADPSTTIDIFVDHNTNTRAVRGIQYQRLSIGDSDENGVVASDVIPPIRGGFFYFQGKGDPSTYWQFVKPETIPQKPKVDPIPPSDA